MAGEGTIRAILTYFEIHMYYQNDPNFNDVYSRNNLSKIKDVVVINLDELKLIETDRIALHVNGGNGSASYDATFFDGIGVEHILKEIKDFIENKNIILNTYRIQAYKI